MTKMTKILCIIPARKGSKGVPRKNTKILAGKPLLSWTFESAIKAKVFNKIILSSDDKDAQKLAHSSTVEVPFTRPSELSIDSAKGVDVALHAIESCQGYDWIVYLQPTSPLRTAKDISNGIAFTLNSGAPCCISVTPCAKPVEWLYFRENDTGILDPILATKSQVYTRQEAKEAFEINGAFYMAKTDWLKEKKDFLTKETVSFVMPRDRSLDIDTEMDFWIAERILSGN